MRSELKVRFSPRDEFELSMLELPPMDNQEARTWLDQEFVRLECEPIRGSGKVLNADKVVRVAQAAGPKAFADRAWAETFARAARAALARDVIVVDAENTTVSF